jgi:LysM repeat protein
MFEPNTTLRLNIIMLIIAAGVFAFVFLAPERRPAISTRPTPPEPAATPTPAPTQPGSESQMTSAATPLTMPTREPTAPATTTLTPLPSQTPTPTATVEPPTATPTPEPVVEHTVVAGETLSIIAARYGVTIEDLVAANGLADPNQLEVGQVLRIPQPATPTP